MELKLEGNYIDFTDFYDENKELIYKSIIELYKESLTTKKKTLTLFLSTKLSGLDYDTVFNFSKDDPIVLKRDIIPYFEQIENYEICGEVNVLYNTLTS